MFVVSELCNVVRVEAHRLKRSSIYDALRQALNNKFVNKVLLNCGLFIKVLDFLPESASTDFHILPGDGAVHKKVYFRAIVFRPFLNEVLEGRVRSLSPEGVKISLEFFDDIMVQGMRMQHPSRWDPTKGGCWIWDYGADDGDSHELCLEVGDRVRFRIVDEKFTDCSPVGPLVESTQQQRNLPSSYALEAAMNEPGLGVLSWWSST
ncbi:DNA-directed RNA polymerase III subunit RPC8-like [Tropilaelaps mercedesae]|uniref:DNA-directed RNA polymerase III subunit RPC8-like n=1 Tax=Tropilaelaps mercedesae TaxID=418985 RepID=A0A1V9WZI3_9ACAR|nr:DNA-directed RNA polymerase III subunit RPC8-like [Tropilaelaps mercedesae]